MRSTERKGEANAPRVTGVIAHVDRCALSRLSADAAAAPRRRAHLLLHERAEDPQELVIAIEPGSYVRPHLHPVSAAWTGRESLTVLRGGIAVLLFDLDGVLAQRIELGPSEHCTIPGGQGHGVAALEPGSILYEVKPGSRPDPDRIWLPGTIEETDLEQARAQALAWARRDDDG